MFELRACVRRGAERWARAGIRPRTGGICVKNAERLAFATLGATFFLVIVGVIVRATDSGLGCSNWPTCEGGVLPPGHSKALIESSHRIMASLVGLLVIAVAFMAWRHFRHVSGIFWVALVTVPLVGFQGILGAITVKRELPPEIVATHLLTAMSVLVCEAFVAFGMMRVNRRNDTSAATTRSARFAVGRLSILALVWLAALMWIGAYMAESGASTACASWPTCNGGQIFPGNDSQEITHMVHRYLAAGFLLVILPFVVSAIRRKDELPWAKPIAHAVIGLYVAQVTVGALNVWFTFPDTLTVLHTAIASGIWLSLASAAVLSYYTPAPARRARCFPAAEVPA
jgi:heme A synthase